MALFAMVAVPSRGKDIKYPSYCKRKESPTAGGNDGRLTEGRLTTATPPDHYLSLVWLCPDIKSRHLTSRSSSHLGLFRSR